MWLALNTQNLHHHHHFISTHSKVYAFQQNKSQPVVGDSYLQRQLPQGWYVSSSLVLQAYLVRYHLSQVQCQPVVGNRQIGIESVRWVSLVMHHPLESDLQIGSSSSVLQAYLVRYHLSQVKRQQVVENQQIGIESVHWVSLVMHHPLENGSWCLLGAGSDCTRNGFAQNGHMGNDIVL